MSSKKHTPADDKSEVLTGQQLLASLNADELILGVPSKLFWGGIASTVAFAFVLRSAWYLSLLWMFIYFVAVFAMHEDNPKAARAWIKALRQPTRWQAKSFHYKSLYFINKD